MSEQNATERVEVIDETVGSAFDVNLAEDGLAQLGLFGGQEVERQQVGRIAEGQVAVEPFAKPAGAGQRVEGGATQHFAKRAAAMAGRVGVVDGTGGVENFEFGLTVGPVVVRGDDASTSSPLNEQIVAPVGQGLVSNHLAQAQHRVDRRVVRMVFGFEARLEQRGRDQAVFFGLFDDIPHHLLVPRLENMNELDGARKHHEIRQREDRDFRVQW